MVESTKVKVVTNAVGTEIVELTSTEILKLSRRQLH